jgi:hypothetical protein
VKTPLTFILALACFSVFGQLKTEKAEKLYTESFDEQNCHYAHAGTIRYFLLRPGYQLTLRGIRNKKDTTELIITVLNETKTFGNMMTRIVEERETVNGKTKEVSKNYVAICKESNNIFYFGEDVDIYRHDSIASHEGSWTAEGKNKPGIMVPGMPLLGARYYEEMAPGVAMDRAEIISMTDTVQTPAGTFTNVLKILETTPLDSKDKSYKCYAPGIGLIKDGNLELIKYGSVPK